MSSAKGKLLRLVARVVLQRARVASVEDVADGFRRITLRGPLPRPDSGTKAQVLLPTDDVRTYTPIPTIEDGTITFLCWTHAGGPGSRWARSIMTGEEVRFLGPQRSLDLPDAPIIVVGDETSIGVAASFECGRSGEVRTVLMCERPEEAHVAAESVGLRKPQIVGRGEAQDVVDAVVAAHAAEPSAKVFLTGGSDLVVQTRTALRTRGISNITSKAYWVPGKTGLD